MLSALDPGAAARVDELSREFLEAKPFRHVVIESFLEPSFCVVLMTQFPPFDRRMQDPKFLSLIGRITSIPSLLYDPEYIGNGTHENLHG